MRFGATIDHITYDPRLIDQHQNVIIDLTDINGKQKRQTMTLLVADLVSWGKGEKLIQNALPYLTVAEREFLMTGLTQEEWDDIFGEDSDE